VVRYRSLPWQQEGDPHVAGRFLLLLVHWQVQLLRFHCVCDAILAKIVANKKYRLTYFGRVVKQVLLHSCRIILPFTPNSNCYEKWPIPKNKPVERWDCDHIGRDMHHVFSLALEDDMTFVLDLTAAQYGFTEKGPGDFPLVVRPIELMSTYAMLLTNHEPIQAWDEAQTMSPCHSTLEVTQHLYDILSKKLLK
jgi:hypothetical protein